MQPPGHMRETISIFLALLTLKVNLYPSEPLIRINIISVSIGYIFFKRTQQQSVCFPYTAFSAHGFLFYFCPGKSKACYRTVEQIFKSPCFLNNNSYDKAHIHFAKRIFGQPKTALLAGKKGQGASGGWKPLA